IFIFKQTNPVHDLFRSTSRRSADSLQSSGRFRHAHPDLVTTNPFAFLTRPFAVDVHRTSVSMSVAPVLFVGRNSLTLKRSELSAFLFASFHLIITSLHL